MSFLQHHIEFTAFILIFLGAFVQTAIGFGLAVVASPLLFMVDPDYVPSAVTLMALILSLMNAIKFKANIAIGGLKNALVWRIPGSVIGGGLLLYVSKDVLSLWLGGLVLFAVAVSFLPFRVEPTPKRMGIAGFFSGFFGTSSGIGGPPMALLLQHQEANQLRGNLAAFFVFSSLISLVVQFFVGYFTWHHVLISLPLIPATVIGYIFAIKFTSSLDKKKVRYGALTLCLLSGVTSIVNGLF
ncbi:sulfite exporter TauE/SafE family protein [Vibrio viridaestus]|uniref:Probable membrane transporter protein n=1 Tax=Vibrio viridaestus TaxID=2487322 RepID=A0A3N9U5R3_9VIBR|nr:sulfite exporter TauE/SafE family protein [Vibrio viridaestus]RQW65052.1 sulfite exporter TauE/SafE family protein [Vibrio viridaestus]